MKFEAPNSYSKDPGILTIENGDPSFDKIKKVFEENGLQVTKKDGESKLEVTILKPKGILETLYIITVSRATYIRERGMNAVNKLELG